MTRFTLLTLIFALSLPALVACNSEGPPATPVPTPEVVVEQPETPARAATPRPEPEPEAEPAVTPPAPGISVELNLGGFNARAFSNFDACSGAALSLSGEAARCRSNCECMGAHDGPDSQEQCMISCSAN